MNVFSSRPKHIFRQFCLLMACLLAASLGYAQPLIVVPYPAPAQDLTQSLGQSLLTVRIAFPAACTGTKLRVSFPPDVLYVPGSITRTAGSGPLITATESDITNRNAPEFNLNNITAAGEITLSLARTVTCSNLGSGKDTVRVSGSCGTAAEASGSVNTYNLLAPALSISGPAALTGAIVGNTYSRSFTVTNGGNGCLDTLRLAVLRSAGTFTSLSLETGTTVLSPFRSSGDTSFYKISGALLPTAGGLMCNGETITFTERFTLSACTGLTTQYIASWGRQPNSPCQSAASTGTVTIATGVPNISALFTRVRNLNWCQAGSYTIRYTNNGSGAAAGAAYSILAQLGYNVISNATAPSGLDAYIPGRVDSVKIGSVTVPVVAATSSTPLRANFEGLTADPDGAGLGLEDLDNDGRFDDLAPGQSVTITVYERWNTPSTACPTPAYGFFTSHTLSYRNMCGTSFTTNPLSASGAYRVQTNNGGNLTAPAEIAANTPFTVQACVNQGAYGAPAYRPVDSLYLDVSLPPGLQLAASPNIRYNGTAVTSYRIDTVAGVRTLRVARKGKSGSFCFSLDLVYDCSAGSPVSPQFSIWYQGDTCSQSIERHMCRTAAIRASCPAPCATGMLNYLPVANRLSLGYTDATMSTKVSAAAVSGLARYTAVPLDTIQLLVAGKQGGTAALLNNLYYNLQFGRAAGADVFRFLEGTFNQKTPAGTVSAAMAAPVTTASTTALQRMNWNLSSSLRAGLISTGDSVWLDLRFVVTRANNDLLYGSSLAQVPNTSSSLYNLDLSGNAIGCDTAHAVNLLLTSNTTSNYTPAITVSNCNVTGTGSTSYHGNGSGLDIFPAEYRPQSIIDSIVLTLPAGYMLASATPGFTTSYWASLTSYGNYAASTAGILTQRGSNVWVISNPYLASGGWPLSDIGNNASGCYNLSYSIAPTCAVVVGTQNYTARWYYRDFVYTAAPAAYAAKSYTANAAITYNATVTPSLSLQNNTGTIQGVLPQHSWEVQLNSSGTGTPPYVWMALDRSGSAISIDSVVYEGTNITASGLAYGSGRTWYQLSPGGIPSGASRKARIYFKYTRCTADSIKVLAGWNCTGYPAPDPAANNCTELSQYLKVIPQPGQVQLSMLRQPGNGGTISLCTRDSLVILVNSAQAANLVDPYVDIIAPVGTTLSSPVIVEYPYGSGNIQAVGLTTVAGAYRVALSGHSGIAAAGLPGTTANPGTAGRQAQIRIYYTTDCSVISGYPVSFRGYGKQPCGSDAIGNGITLNTTGIRIEGAMATGAAGTAFRMSPASWSCGAKIPVTQTIIPLITGSQAGDTVICTLPEGLVYAGNFSQGSNCGGCRIQVSPGAAGTTQLKISLTPGIAVADSLKFSYEVSPSGKGCGTAQLSANVVRNITGLSCGAVACTGSKAVIGSGNSPALTLQKPELVITDMRIDSTRWVAGQYQHVYLFYRNNGSQTYTANTDTVEWFCGAAASPFAALPLGKTLAPGAADSQRYWVFIPKTACATGDLVTARIRAATASGRSQCLCAESAYQLAGVPLPLRFTAASASVLDCRVQLSWTYSISDDQLHSFEIERMDANRFRTIAIVDARSGSFTDEQSFNGRQYYRLKATMVSGEQTYSPVLQANGCGSTLDVYPNPASTRLFINGAAAQTYRLLDMTGVSVREGRTNENGRAEIDVRNLPSGSYLLRLLGAADAAALQVLIRHD